MLNSISTPTAAWTFTKTSSSRLRISHDQEATGCLLLNSHCLRACLLVWICLVLISKHQQWHSGVFPLAKGIIYSPYKFEKAGKICYDVPEPKGLQAKNADSTFSTHKFGCLVWSYTQKEYDRNVNQKKPAMLILYEQTAKLSWCTVNYCHLFILRTKHQ